MNLIGKIIRVSRLLGIYSVVFTLTGQDISLAAELNRVDPPDQGAIATKSPAQAAPSSQIVEMKLSLLRQLFQSETIRNLEASGQAPAIDWIAEAQRLMSVAESDVEDGAVDRAEFGLDEAIRLLTFASRHAAKKRQWSEKRGRTDFAEVERNVRSYLRILQRPQVEEELADAGGARLQIETLLDQASALDKAGEADAAQDRLLAAYRLSITTIATVSQGKTVYHELNFETARDEYEYEYNRNVGYTLLVEMMLQEQPSNTNLRRFVAHQMDLSLSARDRAEAFAAKEDYAVALSLLEESIIHLVKAMRAGGLPVFE